MSPNQRSFNTFKVLKKSLFGGALLLIAGCKTTHPVNAAASAQDPIQTQLERFNDSGNYLAAIRLLEREVVKGPHENEAHSQTLAFYLADVGSYAAAVSTVHQAWGEPPRVQLSPDDRQRLERLPLAPARDAICAEIKKHQIVIINENHHHPQHRAFGRALLPCFKNAGFTHFALETIGEETAEINARGRVSRRKTGYYAYDPQMAALINEGLHLGFKIVRYETRDLCMNCAMEDQIDRREEQQADNLMNEIFRSQPHAKALIWVGFSHAYKRQLKASPKTRWMAARLWEKSGVEPFTIEQLSEQFAWNAHQPAYEPLTQSLGGEQPGYLDLNSHWTQIPTAAQPSLRKTEKAGPPAIDAVVVHPRRRVTDARHLWLGWPAARTSRMNQAKRESELVQIFSPKLSRDQLEDEAPLDQVICEKDQACELIAPPGRYWVRTWTEQGLQETRQQNL